MDSYIIQPNMIRLCEESRVKRAATRPSEHQEPDYLKKYDDRTLFYDALVSNGELILIGPPLLNLEQMVKEASITVSGKPIDTITTERLERNQITRIGLSCELESEVILELCHPVLGDHHITAGPADVDIFESSNVLMTMQKNEEPQWIEDWVRYYVRVHGVDSVLLFDNNSTEYSTEVIRDRLRRIPGLRASVIVEWPFPYGPQGGRWVGTGAAWDSDFCQIGALQTARYRFLGSAEGVINADVDELVVPLSEKTLFDELAVSDSGVIGYSGHWIENQSTGLAESEIPRFWNYIQSKGDDAATTSKWTAKVSKWASDAQPTAHFVRNIDYYPSPDFYTAHFKGINSGWKRADRLKASVSAGELGYDSDLIRALGHAFPERTETIEAGLGQLNSFPIDMSRYRFRAWLRAQLAFATELTIPWNKIWLWKSAVPVFEMATPLGQLAFDLHLGPSAVRMAVVVRDSSYLPPLSHSLEAISEQLDELTDRNMGFWTTEHPYSPTPDSSWQFACWHIKEQMFLVLNAVRALKC